RLISLSAGTRWTEFKTKDIRGKDEPGFDQASFNYSDTYSILGGRNNLGLSFTSSYRSSPNLLDEVGTFSGLAIANHYLLPTATNVTPRSNTQASEVLPIGNSVATLTSQMQQKTLKAYAVSTGFEHKMPGINSRLNVDLSYSIARSGYPINSSITANMTDKIGW